MHGALASELAEMTAGGIEAQNVKMQKFLKAIRAMPIAIEQSSANEQHYEVVFGGKLKSAKKDAK